MVADRDQLRSEMERVNSDCSAVRNRLAAVEAVKSGLEVLADPQSSSSLTFCCGTGRLRALGLQREHCAYLIACQGYQTTNAQQADYTS